MAAEYVDKYITESGRCDGTTYRAVVVESSAVETEVSCLSLYFAFQPGLLNNVQHRDDSTYPTTNTVTYKGCVIQLSSYRDDYSDATVLIQLVSGDVTEGDRDRYDHSRANHVRWIRASGVSVLDARRNLLEDILQLQVGGKRTHLSRLPLSCPLAYSRAG